MATGDASSRPIDQLLSAIERDLSLCLIASKQVQAERQLEREQLGYMERVQMEQSCRIAEMQIEGEECARHLEEEIDRLLSRVEAATPAKTPREPSRVTDRTAEEDQDVETVPECSSEDGRSRKRGLQASLARAKQERDAALERERVALRQSDDACKALKDLHAAYLVNLRRKARSSLPDEAGKSNHKTSDSNLHTLSQIFSRAPWLLLTFK